LRCRAQQFSNASTAASRGRYLQSTLMMQTFTPYILFAVGLTLILYAVINSDKKAKLRQTGQEAEGIIFDIDKGYQDFSIENEVLSTFQDRSKKVWVRFVTQKLEWVTAPIDQDFQIFFSFQYSKRDKVKIFYDSDNPNNFYVDTKQSALIGRLIILLSGVGMVIAGYTQLTHAN